MSKTLNVYKDKSFSDAFTGDDQYLDPIRFGTVVKPVDTTSEYDGVPFPVWIRNDGDEPVFNVQAGFTAGPAGRGGQPGNLEATYPELALDDRSRLPYCQARKPTSFTLGQIYIDNAVSVDHKPKDDTGAGNPDDRRTLLPSEYCVIWMKCSIRRDKIPGGVWPPPHGMKNLRLVFSTRMFGMSFYVGLQLVVDTDLDGETYYLMDGENQVLWP